MELSRDKVKEIINDDWLLMDDCEGNKNCDVVKELARIALASLEAEAVAVRARWKDEGSGHGDWKYYDIAHRDALIADETRDCELIYSAPASAAMLQGAEPVTTPYKLPANTPCKEAPEHIWLQTSGVWTENAEFSELTWCSDNQHPDDTLYVRADVVAGNSPLTPDGWKLVPVEPTTNQWAAGMQAFDSGMDKVTRVYKAMLAAAPRQEVNQ